MKLPEDADEDKYMNINLINGYYYLKIGENITIDVDEFEKLINQGNFECRTNSENAINLCDAALNMYKGAYLSEISYEIWLVSSRNYLSQAILEDFVQIQNHKVFGLVVLYLVETDGIEPLTF